MKQHERVQRVRNL